MIHMKISNNEIAFIFSLVGFIELFIFIIGIVFFQRLITERVFSIFVDLEPIIIYSAWIFDIIGLVFGIKGLKTDGAKYAKIGIGLSIAGLLEYVLFYYILALMFGLPS